MKEKAMFLFTRKEDVLTTRSRQEADAAEKALNATGIRCHRWRQEPIPVGGCGAKMRPSDWQKGLKVENNDEKRMIYHVEVAVEDLERAKAAVQGKGL
jgi:hypothetical protein